MKNLSPKRTYSQEDRSASNRDDARRTNDYSHKTFSKDRRPQNGPRYEYKPRNTDSRSDSAEGTQRRSYNPNFTRDNKPVGNRNGENKKPTAGYQRSRSYEPGSQLSDRQNREYGNRPDNQPSDRQRTPYGRTENAYKKPYRPAGQRPEGYGNDPRRQSGYKKPYNSDRPAYETDGNGREADSVRTERRPRPQRPEYKRNGETADTRRYQGDKPRQSNGYGKKGYQNRSPRNGRRAPGDYPSYPAPEIGETMRLNRYIAMSGLCSRREADTYIQAGVVSVNGNTVTELGSKISEGDDVRFNGEPIKSEKKVYIVMNKPKGFVTSLDDPHAEKTVMDLLKNSCKERVYPVGRLDKNSVGVLLVTNDGDLAKKLTHPSYEKKKVYQVTLDRPVTEEDMERIANGITLEDGEIYADAISYVSEKKNEVGVEIHSGRNRIVRRMFEHLGYRIQKLDRVYFAGLTKQRLKRGAWRHLTPQEVAILKSGRYE